MNILVLGGDGMLGHRLVNSFAGTHRVSATFRRSSVPGGSLVSSNLHRSYFQADLRDTDRLRRILDDCSPEVVINAAGIVKNRDAAGDPILSIEVNSLLPHRLAQMTSERGARMIQISTDCVFSGEHGDYREDDRPDPPDLYGRTKLLGEVTECRNALTIRTSIIGWELYRKQGLLEWFVAQPGPVRGYAKAIFSGLTTIELSRLIGEIAVSYPDLNGLYHVSADPISKLDLLRLIGQKMHPSCEIIPDETLRIDRSLNSTRFRKATGYVPPTWPDMVAALAVSAR